ncbi:MAG: PAS domain-containing protein [Pseudomonadota bacterium]|nr:PAS domain-containing protein [Pseudomonadota bacterium]
MIFHPTEPRVQGFGWTSAIHPDDVEPTIVAWKDAVADKRTFIFEHRLRRNDGQWRNYSIRSVPRVDDDGTIVEWVGVHTDVTDRRITEQALRESEARLRDLNETLERRIQDAVAERKLFFDVVEGSDALWQIIDLDLRYLAINTTACQEFERIYGKRPEVGGGSIDMLATWPERQRIARNLWNRALAGETFTCLVDLNASDLNPRWYEFKYAPLRNASAEIVGASASALDVSERVEEQTRLAEAEEALRQAQKMEAVGQLTGGLAHDFNNLLTAMMGNLELLQVRVQRGRLDDLDRFVNAAQGAGRRAASLTQRLLAFSRRQTLDPRPTDVNRLIVGIEELLRRTVGPTYNIEVAQAAGLWPTMIDPAQLENALLNLCINARDAMTGGGRITIETANKWLDDRTGRERDLPPGQYLSVCVSDTGTGMTSDVVARAFDPFYTTKPIGEGTGLGLSMIYGFARQSGGQVRIYSEIGIGTTVCIYLPRHAGEVDAALASPEPEALDVAKGEAILVVDDEATIRHLIDEVLDDLGYTVIGAADGAAGLKVLQSNAKIELLITDVGLPNGMNGRQVADAARSLRPGLKVLFITGYAENAAVGNGHMEPGMELLTKPFALADLSRKVRDMLVR